MINYTQLYKTRQEPPQPPTGLNGDNRNIEDLVKCDDSIKQLIKEKHIKGVEAYNTNSVYIGMRYIIPLRKSEILICYVHDHPLPKYSQFNDDEIRYISSIFYKRGKRVQLHNDDHFKVRF